jgi:hypothetical protein
VAREASLTSRKASQRVRRGGGGLAWPIYGGWGLCSRWHAVLWQTLVNSCSGRVRSERGRTIKTGVGFIAAGAGVGLSQRGAARVGPSAEACSGVARAHRTCGRVKLHEFLRLQSSQTCESCHMSCVRFLPCT